ncbi:MAG: Ig-like domain-containing protein [Chloroflexota bacterium]
MQSHTKPNFISRFISTIASQAPPILGLLLLLLLSTSSSLASSTGERRAPNVLDQFEKLQRHGDPIAVRVGVGGTDYAPGPSVGPCKHYQGMARGESSNGTPYFFLTRSRNATGSCELGGWDPGELLIAKLGSRDQDGERLRSNRLKPDKDFQDTAPPSTDIGKVAVYFDGDIDPINGKTWPKNWHPGGVQLVEDVLVVPLECSCGGLSLAAKTNCEDAQTWCSTNGIALIDVSSPESPELLLHQTYPALSDGIGVVGVTKDPATGKYLFAYTWGDDDYIRFAWSDTDDLRTTTSIPLESYTWNATDIDFAAGCSGCTWRSWQTLNFVRQTDGDLYMIGGDNSSSDPTSGDDYIGLFKLDTSKLNSSQIGDAITYIRQRHFKIGSDPDMGDLDAVMGVYVSPTGQLIVYSGDHDGKDKEEVKIIQMGEFHSRQMTDSGQCGPQWNSNHLGGPYTIDEGSSLVLEGSVYAVEPWVMLFENTSYNLFDEGNTLTMDWRYQYQTPCNNYDCDEYNDFTGSGLDYFNDVMSSFTFCGPGSADLYIYDDDNFDTGGNAGYIHCDGVSSGDVLSVSNVASLPGRCGWYNHDDDEPDFNDEATSMKITWSAPSAPYSWSLSGSGGSLTGASTSTATFHAGCGDSTNTVTLTYQPYTGNTVQATVNVQNVAPAIASITSAPSSPHASDEVTLTVNWSDPCSTQASLTIDWDDGSAPENFNTSDTSFETTHTYARHGDYDVQVCASDGEDSSCQNHTIHVLNSAPVITQGSSTSTSVDEDGGPVGVNLSATDADNDTLTWSIHTPADNGIAAASGTGASKTVTYTPDSNWNGADSFIVQVEDGYGGSDTISVYVTVNPRNDPPFNTSLPSVTGAYLVGSPLNGSRGAWSDATDITPGSVTYTYQWQHADDASGANQADIPSATALNYTPTAADAHKYLRLRVTATDDGEGVPPDSPMSASAFTTWMLVNNSAPSIIEPSPAEVTMDEDATPLAFGLLLHASDADQDTLTWSIHTQAQHGLASASGAGLNKSIDYTPDPDWNGADSFVVQVEDGYGGSDTLTVNVTVRPVNDPPSFVKGPDVSVVEDSGPYAAAWATGLSVGPANEAGQSLSFAVTANTNPALFSTGPAVAPDGSLSFTLALDANGSALVTLVLHDDGGTAYGGVDTSPPQQFTITIDTRADLALSKSADPQSLLPGNTVVFTLQASNLGPSAASGLALSDLLPAGLSFAAASPGCLEAGGTVTCDLGGLPEGASASVLISATVDLDASGTLLNQASLSAAAPLDPLPDNNAAQASVIVLSSQAVYSLDDTPGPEWSDPRLDTTPCGETFLGRYGDQQPLSLNLQGLPVHSQAMVLFDLYIIGSWTGNTPGDWSLGADGQPVYIETGPDRWRFSADGGSLLDTTFSNGLPKDLQAFPGFYPGGSYPPRTGAISLRNLCYETDSVYALSFTFDHSASDLSLDFFASLKDKANNETWGLDNLRILLSSGGPFFPFQVWLPFSTH